MYKFMREPVIAEMMADFHCRKSFFLIFETVKTKKRKMLLLVPARNALHFCLAQIIH